MEEWGDGALVLWRDWDDVYFHENGSFFWIWFAEVRRNYKKLVQKM